MGGHHKHSSSKEDEDRHRHRSRDTSHARDSSRMTRDSNEPIKSTWDSNEPNKSLDSTSRSSDRPPKTSAESKQSHAVSAEGVTHCPAGAPRNENEASGSQDGRAHTEERMDRLFSMMDTVMAKINDMEYARSPAVHEISDNEGCDFDYDQENDARDIPDPMDHLSGIFAASGNCQNDDDFSNDFERAMAEFAGVLPLKKRKQTPSMTAMLLF